MIISERKYVNATKSFPLKFDSVNEGKDTDLLVEAYFYDDEEEAKTDLSRFDEPESRQVIPVTVIYEF